MLTYHRKLQQRHAQGGDEGFTLIELLIVIVVLGILAAVVIFALGGVTSQSAVSACNSDAKSVETAIAAYNAQNSPITANGTSALVAAQNAQTAVQTALVPTYLHSWPSNLSHYALTAYTGGTTITGPVAGTYTWTSNGDVSVYPGNFSAGFTVNASPSTPVNENMPGISYDGQTSATGCNAVK